LIDVDGTLSINLLMVLERAASIKLWRVVSKDEDRFTGYFVGGGGH
jgi:hypothetical protein